MILLTVLCFLQMSIAKNFVAYENGKRELRNKEIMPDDQQKNAKPILLTSESMDKYAL